jgi:hypothetical protein
LIARHYSGVVAMSFGRLDVFWPDGNFNSYPLEGDNISVGRSSGNTIMLETDTISRYHFSISRDASGKVFVTDLESVNSTYLGGEKIDANVPTPIDDGAEIQAGQLRIIYHSAAALASFGDANATNLLEDTQPNLRFGHNFKVEVLGAEQPVTPGTQITAQISIYNTSDEGQRFRVDIAGVPQEWVRLERHELFVDAHDTIPILVYFKPLRTSDSKPGDYPVVIVVSPKDKPTVTVDYELRLKVLAFSGFGMALQRSDLQAGEKFTLHVQNQGSAPLALNFSARQPDNTPELNVTVTPNKVTLSAGQRLKIQGEATPKSPLLFGNTRDHQFDVIARSEDAAGFTAAVRLHMEEAPRLPSWMIYAGGGLGATLLMSALYLLWGLLGPPPAPSLVGVALNSSQITVGTPVGITWQASNANSLQVVVNGTPVATANPAQGGMMLDLGELSGDVQIELRASNGRTETTSQALTLSILTPAPKVFTAEPTTPYRHLAQSLTIRWNIPNAVNVMLTGLEGLTQDTLQASYPAEGELTVTILPTVDFALTLISTDTQGAVTTQTLPITLLNPLCTVIAPTVEARVGPADTHQVIATLAQNDTLEVDARDLGASAQWVRAQAVGGTSVWLPRAAINCPFNIDELRTEVNVPPTPTLTVTPPPSTTPTARISATPRPPQSQSAAPSGASGGASSSTIAPPAQPTATPTGTTAKPSANLGTTTPRPTRTPATAGG